MSRPINLAVFRAITRGVHDRVVDALDFVDPAVDLIVFRAADDVTVYDVVNVPVENEIYRIVPAQ